MINKDALYENIMSELNPLWAELDKIETELKLMWEFNHDSELDRKHEDKLDERAVYQRFVFVKALIDSKEFDELEDKDKNWMLFTRLISKINIR